MNNILKAIKELLTAPNGTNKLGGYALGLLHKGKIYILTEGLASIEDNLPITVDTKFHLASLTKHFTAGIFRQVERQGLIRETDYLTSFFPNEYLREKEIMLKDLLNHTSGLRDQWELCEYAGWGKHDVITNSHIVELYQQQRQLNFHPGKYYAYCNTGYTLLGLILEKVTGQSIRVLLKEYITQFCPALNTGYYSYDEVISSFSQAYTLSSSGTYKLSKPQFDVIGATSMYSSVKDLINFEKGYFKNLADKDYYDNSTNSVDYYYQDGLINLNLNGVKLQMHSGWDYGYSSFLIRLPQLKTSIVILCNHGKPNLFNIAIKISSILAPNLIQRNLLNLIIAPSTNLNIANKLKPGFYKNSDSNTVIEIKETNGYLLFESSKMHRIDEQSYLIDESINRVFPITDSEFYLKILDTELKYERINLQNTVFDEIRYQGVFYSEELNVYYEVYFEAHSLILKGPKLTKYTFSKVSSGIYKGKSMTLVFSRENERLLMYLSNLRAWNLKFKKIPD